MLLYVYVLRKLNELNLVQATEKQSSEGVSLGEDVLTLRVEPHVDQSLLMALFTVYALINNKL